MKLRQRLSLGLALLLTLGLYPPAVAAEASAYQYLRIETQTPGPGLTYISTTMQHSSAGREEERMLRYTPDSRILPVVASGDKMYYNTLSIDEAYNRLRSQGLTPIACINGDFFNSNGTPVSLLVQNGVLKSYNNNCAALGFDAAGKPYIGAPSIQITVTDSTGQSVNVDQLNKIRQNDLVYLYTPDFSETTRTNQNGRHVVLTVDSSLSLGHTVTGKVTKILDGTTAYTLAANEMVLSANTALAIDKFRFLVAGSTVTIKSQSLSPVWNDVVTAVGGLRYLVYQSKIQSFNTTDAGRAPRSAAGLTAKGELILYTVDGRQTGYSHGLTLTELAQRMIELGCVIAMELDGGGSTTMAIRSPGETAFNVVNQPSDKATRKCSNFLFFCNTAPVLNTPELLFPEPANVTMLTNASVSFSFSATDRNYHPAAAPLSGYTGLITGDLGTVSGNVFTAQSTGSSTIFFNNGNASGTADILVTDKLDSLTLLDRETGSAIPSLTIAPARPFALDARGTLNLLPVLSSPSSYEWFCDENIGSFLEPGLFMSGETIGATGYITVKGGGQTLRIPVTLGTEPIIISDFESSLGILSTGSILFRAEHVTSTALSGFGMAKLSYQFLDNNPNLSLSLNYSTAAWPVSLQMLIQGDGSDNSLYLRTTTQNGSVSELPVTILDFTDTRLISVALPDRCTSLNALILKSTGTVKNGSIILDHMILSWQDERDIAPPRIVIGDYNASFGILRIPVNLSSQSGHLPQDIRFLWDGAEMPTPTIDENGNADFTVLLPTGGLHFLTVETADIYGRRAREQLMVHLEDESLYDITDMENHWAKNYIIVLDSIGAIETLDSFGLRYFEPGRAATRMEVFRMLYHILSPDITNTTPVVLPFTDMDTIEESDIPILEVLYTLGIVAGKSDGNNGVYLDGGNSISRADLCVLLTRTIPKGYSGDLFETFTDVSSIPAYAIDAMRQMVNMKIMNGSDGKLNPSKSITRAETAALLCRMYF